MMPERAWMFIEDAKSLVDNAMGEINNDDMGLQDVVENIDSLIVELRDMPGGTVIGQARYLTR